MVDISKMLRVQCRHGHFELMMRILFEIGDQNIPNILATQKTTKKEINTFLTFATSLSLFTLHRTKENGIRIASLSHGDANELSKFF